MASGGGEGEVGLLVSEEVEPEAFVMREREDVTACLCTGGQGMLGIVKR